MSGCTPSLPAGDDGLGYPRLLVRLKQSYGMTKVFFPKEMTFSETEITYPMAFTRKSHSQIWSPTKDSIWTYFLLGAWLNSSAMPDNAAIGGFWQIWLICLFWPCFLLSTFPLNCGVQGTCKSHLIPIFWDNFCMIPVQTEAPY